MVSLLERQAKKLKVTVELKEERFESFFNVTFHCKQACKLPKCVLKESKKVILFEVFELEKILPYKNPVRALFTLFQGCKLAVTGL